MKKYYLYLNPEKLEPFRFVVGVKRRWLFWKKAIFSNLPVCVSVNDYKELEDLAKLASKESGLTAIVKEEDVFKEENEKHRLWAIRSKSDDIVHPKWYTGRWFKNKDGQGSLPEVVQDIRYCQMFVREVYALGALSQLNRSGYDGILESVYVNVVNLFQSPCIVTICINKRTGNVRYLKSYKENDHRLRYTECLDEAMLLFPEEVERTYDYLVTSHKELSFTMVAKPDIDIPAKELKAREKDLKQGIACDFFLIGHEKKKD